MKSFRYGRLFAIDRAGLIGVRSWVAHASGSFVHESPPVKMCAGSEHHHYECDDENKDQRRIQRRAGAEDFAVRLVQPTILADGPDQPSDRRQDNEVVCDLGLVAVDIFPECCDPNYRKAQEHEIAKYHDRGDLVLVHVTVIAQPRSLG